jgi:hypothetical protein
MQIRSWTDTQITFRVPSYFLPGRYRVSITPLDDGFEYRGPFGHNPSIREFDIQYDRATGRCVAYNAELDRRRAGGGEGSPLGESFKQQVQEKDRERLGLESGLSGKKVETLKKPDLVIRDAGPSGEFCLDGTEPALSKLRLQHNRCGWNATVVNNGLSRSAATQLEVIYESPTGRERGSVGVPQLNPRQAAHVTVGAFGSGFFYWDRGVSFKVNPRRTAPESNYANNDKVFRERTF